MIRNQRGITLIELLAALVILSFIGVIIWNVFIQGYKFSKRSVSENYIQQEANYVNTSLIRIHQTSSQYIITNANCTISISITNQDGTGQTKLFSDSNLCYSINITGAVNPGTDDKTISLIVSDRKDPTNKVIINTLLYRLKNGGV